MKIPKERFKQNIAFEIEGNHDLNTRINYAVVKTGICTYYLNEEKCLQE